MPADSDRAYPRPSPAVRDAERLVQVEVGHVGAEPSRPGEAHQRVEVGAVHVHLAARGVHEVAHAGHGRLEDAVRGRVGQHDRGHPPLVLRQLRLQVADVDGAVAAALDHAHPQPGEHRAGRVRAVRRLRDQAHVAAGVAAVAVIVADRQQAGQFPL